MVQLFLIFCLSHGLSCEVQQRGVYGLPMACLRDGQQVAVEWLREHPAYRLQGVRCRPVAAGRDA